MNPGRSVSTRIGVRVRDGEHDHVVRDRAVADEALRAADDVLVAVLDRPRSQRARVGARLGFREPEGDELLALGEAGQPAVLLLV
jgi:hypothetical protein